jgi:hypothetical protein
LAYLTYDRLLVGTRVTYASYQLMMGLAFWVARISSFTSKVGV